VTAAERFALVTGGNRGIGLETCRQLAARGLNVILASRDPDRGAAAVEALAQEGLTLIQHTLDVTRPEEIEAALEFVQSTCGCLEVLVNNAGIYLDQQASLLDLDLTDVRLTMETNFYGPLRLCRAFAPLMRRQQYGRIVNVSSGYGALSEMGAGAPAYSISKAALNALTCILADELRGGDIKVNAACPGWVHTQMGGPEAPRTPAEGADTIVWLATLPARGPSGGFFRDRRRIPW
jgi:NAD(P)-dependent dehydrogenase (short-subunit alcohol dehydrogenase family)